MRGKTEIINTATDRKSADFSDEQIIEMATTSVRYDDAIYPDDYDQNLKEGDDDFIEPIFRFESEINQVVLDRFGVVI